MVHGQRGGVPRTGILVFGLLALGAVEACGSRSPLLSSFGDGVAGEGETGGIGGSLGGGVGGEYAGGVGGDGYGGVGGTSMGYGGAYPMSAGGAYPMSTGGTYPTAGYGGVGGAYPSAGYGGKGMGVGGAMPGVGGKGMGAGGKGGGKGDPRVYKGCLLACQKYESFCPTLAGDCVGECVFSGSQYPRCSNVFADWLFCVANEFSPTGSCDRADCSGDGCATEAHLLCEGHMEELWRCLEGEPPCATVTEVTEVTCRLQSYCGRTAYDTQCKAVDDTGNAFDCTCSTDGAFGSTLLEDYSVEDACHVMNEDCGFPDAR